ncbi:MAG: hypothetical protein AAB656_04740 [Patescibacteria group bacterium]
MSINHVEQFTSEIFSGSKPEIETEDGFKVELNRKRLHEVLDDGNPNLPFLILVSGTSESGKSHLGKKFVEDKIGHRFKIYKTISELMQNQNLTVVEGVDGFDSVSYATHIQNDPKLRFETTQKVASEYLSIMKKTGVYIGIVETMKHPWLVKELEGRTDMRVLSLFIDAPFSLRANRQAIKHGLRVEDVAGSVSKKDEHKAETGTTDIKKFSDIVVWNSGEVESFNSFIEALQRTLTLHLTVSSGDSIDYS